MTRFCHLSGYTHNTQCHIISSKNTKNNFFLIKGSVRSFIFLGKLEEMLKHSLTLEQLFKYQICEIKINEKRIKKFYSIYAIHLQSISRCLFIYFIGGLCCSQDYFSFMTLASIIVGGIRNVPKEYPRPSSGCCRSILLRTRIYL